jgi:hypothetical protein
VFDYRKQRARGPLRSARSSASIRTRTGVRITTRTEPETRRREKARRTAKERLRGTEYVSRLTEDAYQFFWDIAFNTSTLISRRTASVTAALCTSR